MIRLFRSHKQLLLFGILTAMFSGPGQTFLVSLFIPPMRESFAMSRASIAGFYAAATLASALVMPIMGRFLDRIHLVKFTMVSGLLLALGCLVLSQSVNVWMVFVGFLLIRNLGQGTMSLISSTTMAKTFGHARGKALAIGGLGYPLSEALFPFIITSWIAAYSWRSGWILLAVLMLLFFLPAVLFLLRRDPHITAMNEFNGGQSLKKEVAQTLHEARHWTTGEMLKDRRFYLLLLSFLIPPAFMTGLFFHQGSLMAWKGWSMHIVAAAFVSFAVSRIVISFAVGPMVDRYTAKKIYPYSLIPFALGLLCLAWGRELYWVFIYLAGAGISMGFSMTVQGALWAELYGTKELGSIRGILASLMVLSTAIAPPLLGYWLDGGMNPTSILFGMIALIFFGSLLAWLVCADIFQLKA